MTRENRVILDGVGRLKEANRNLNLAMREITGGIEEINQSLLNITGLSERNRESIEGVREDVSRYTI